MRPRGCFSGCQNFIDRTYVRFVEKYEWRIWLGFGWRSALQARIRSSLCWPWRWNPEFRSLWKKKKKKCAGAEFHDTAGVTLDVPAAPKVRAGNPKVFTYAELYIATRGFSDEELLGAGGFGRVYKARLPSDGSTVAVKCVSEKGHRSFERTLEAELAAVGQLRHKNLVSLKGWCFEHNQLLLVYDYMPNSSLDRVLFARSRSGRSGLDWQRRYRIVEGLAAALFYLHEQLETQIIHRDVKTSNVMLDAAFNARLGDFGLARWIEHEDFHCPAEAKLKNFSNRHFRLAETSRIGGTIGYIPPETLQKRSQATAKSDVFSFGIVALEVATGRRAIDLSQPDDKIVLVDWIRGLHEENQLCAAADSRVLCNSEELKRLLYIGLFCSLNEPASRPTTKWIVQALRGEADFPALPSFKALPYYANLSSSSDSLTITVTTTTERSSTWSVNSSVISPDYIQLADAPREFSLNSIYAATDGFADSRMVAELDFGTAYRGVLPDTKQRVLVKRLGMKTCPALRSRFALELSNLGRVRHRNLVQLRGWCTERGEVLVIYDGNLMNRPLSKLLNSPRLFLDWPSRHRVLVGLASALAYLHEEWEQRVVHKGVTSGNVFLDMDLNPRLGGFALAEFVTRGDEKHHTSGNVRGIFGYMSPEYVASGRATSAADVYAFGVVALEVVSGRPAVNFGVPEALLVQRIKRLEKEGGILQALDPRLEGSAETAEMERIVQLGLLCTRFDPQTRPSMRQVCLILDGDDRLLGFLRSVKEKPMLPAHASVVANGAQLVRRMQALGIH